MLANTDRRKRLSRGAAWLTAAFLIFTPVPAKPQVAITLDILREMNFGEFAASVDGAGNVMLSPNADTVTFSGPVTQFSGKKVQRARFRINGEKKTYVIVSLPSSITIQSASGGTTMIIDDFTMDVSNPVYLGNNGRMTVNIGATLRIGTNQNAGDYNINNSFTFVVEYL